MFRLSVALACCFTLCLAACDDETSPGTDDAGQDAMTIDGNARPDTAAGDGLAADTSTTDQGQVDAAPTDQAVATDGAGDAAAGSCAGQDARGVGPCDMLLGVMFNGVRCISLSGCSCSGKDCKKLYKSKAACETANKKCICAPWDAKGVGACKMLLGISFDGTSCVTLSGCSCSGKHCKLLYKSTELATCKADHTMCGGNSCAPMDANGQGPCTLLLGYKWDGKKCVSFGGCTCVGKDCSKVFKKLADCTKAYSHCP